MIFGEGIDFEGKKIILGIKEFGLGKGICFGKRGLMFFGEKRIIFGNMGLLLEKGIFWGKRGFVSGEKKKKRYFLGRKD